LLLTRTELDFFTRKERIHKPQKWCIKSRLHKKVKEFADKELPVLIEKGLLDGKGFEPTVPAASVVGRGRIELAAHAPDYTTTNNLKRSLDIAGAASSNLARPKRTSTIGRSSIASYCKE